MCSTRLLVLLLSQMLLAPGLTRAWADTPIEAEFAATQTYIVVFDVEKDRVATALVELPDLGGQELVKIDYKPNGRDSSLYRFYWFRDGVLELFREYDWIPRGELAEFKRGSERRIRFEDGVARTPEGGALSADVDAIRREGQRLYALLGDR